ncbi:MAG: ribosome rescue GTPase HflX [Salinisphaeraceae bacterium]|nr:ribosome rescue GTPase HflX [Salinisphaeraceae bacterium]
MFERPKAGNRTVLVHLQIGADQQADAASEFYELARSTGAEILDQIGGTRASPHPKYFVGTGKAEEIAASVQANEAELVVFDHDLSPSQERNLEGLLKCRVLDRTGLILDIFASRARSHEGKLQVELAQLQHLATRLVRGWSHLERQKGGIGLRGPGETQLETDRRLLAVRIKNLRRRLQRVQGQRDQGRQSRRKADVPLVALVGYTNAGKSTLFNQLTGEDIYAADQLFATLDTTLRQLQLDTGHAVVADTVGFIRRLPHDLVAAFRATLEETTQAQLLLHVIDGADPQRLDRIEQVNAVLDEIEATDVPQLQVINKIDLCEQLEPRVEFNASGEPVRAYVSAAKGLGMEALRAAIQARLFPELVEQELVIPAHAARFRARLFAEGAVKDEQSDDDGATVLRLLISPQRLERLARDEGVVDLLKSAG